MRKTDIKTATNDNWKFFYFIGNLRKRSELKITMSKSKLLNVSQGQKPYVSRSFSSLPQDGYYFLPIAKF